MTLSPVRGEPPRPDYDALARACTPNDRANARGALGELRALLLRIIESGLPRESGIEIAAHELVRCIATPSVNDPWNTLGENQKLTYLGWARETVRAYLAAERAVDTEAGRELQCPMCGAPAVDDAAEQKRTGEVLNLGYGWRFDAERFLKERFAGEPSEEVFVAARTAFNRAIINWHWDEAMRQAIRAALAAVSSPSTQP